MLVYIVYMPDAALRGPDLERMNKVEDVPDDLGRMLLNDGSARKPTDEEVAAFEESRKVETKAADADDLTALKKDELVALAEKRGVDVSGAKTKADLVAALEAHQPEPAATTPADGPVDVAPGAGQDHSFDLPTGGEPAAGAAE